MTMSMAQAVSRLRDESIERMKEAEQTQGMARRVLTAQAQLLRRLADEFERELCD